ncbi:MAG: TIGR02594 family protein [Devosia sp.]
MHVRVPWLDYLVHHIGLKEIPGPKHNPTIVEWGRIAKVSWWNNDDDAWCAIAVNGALVNAGYPSTRSALARSFTRYGTRLQRPVRGAIVVFPRGPNPLYGHVGIVEAVHADGTITVVNGNVRNEVRRSTFRVDAILPDGIRWPPGAEAPRDGVPLVPDTPLGVRTLRPGARGADVSALQRDLNVLNYGLRVDGVYGGRTEDAVRRFEGRRGLAADGVADAAVLSALGAAVAERQVRDDRRASARRAAAPIAGAGAAVTVGATVTTGVQVARQIQLLNDGTVIGLSLMLLVLIGVGGVFLWRFAMRRAEGAPAEEPA